MEKNKTYRDGVNIARKIVLDIIEKYNEKPSDNLQEDLKNEINQALDKILDGDISPSNKKKLKVK